MKYTFTDCFISGDSHQRFHRRFVNTASKEEKDAFKRDTRITITNPKRIQYNSNTEDKSIFIHDVTV
jgi:hypothetical protein